MMKTNDIRSPLILAVISAVICLPFGLVAIHYALKTVEYFINGQEKNAALNIMHTKRWAWASVIAGVLFWSLTVSRLITMQ